VEGERGDGSGSVVLDEVVNMQCGDGRYVGVENRMKGVAGRRY